MALPEFRLTGRSVSPLWICGFDELAVLKDWLRNLEKYQDDSVNCSCFAKTQKTNRTQGLFDPCACTGQDAYCTTELCLSVDKLRKKKTNNKEDSSKEENVLVYRCQCLCSVQSVTC